MADICKCFLCNELVEGYVEGLRRHLKVHENRKDFDKNLIHYTCMRKGCRMSYRKFSSLGQHIRTKHPCQIPHMPNGQQPELNDRAEQSKFDAIEDDVPPVNMSVCEPGSSIQGHSVLEDVMTMECLRKFASIEVCKLRADVSFTQTKIMRVMEMCESIIDQINMLVSHRVDLFLANSETKLSPEDIVDLKNDLTVTDIFEDVKSGSKQEQFLKNTIGSIPEPIPIMLRSQIVKQLVNGQEKNVKVNDKVIQEHIKRFFPKKLTILSSTNILLAYVNL